MELQCGNEIEAVDLSGDAGVVGRWLVQGDEEHPELSMDLKGVILSATMVRSVHRPRPPITEYAQSTADYCQAELFVPGQSQYHVQAPGAVLS
jgi:hypothetical protein